MGWFWPLLNPAVFLEAAWAVLKIASSLKPNQIGKFSLPKSVKRSAVCIPVQQSINVVMPFNQICQKFLKIGKPEDNQFSSFAAFSINKFLQRRFHKSRPSYSLKQLFSQVKRPSFLALLLKNLYLDVSQLWQSSCRTVQSHSAAVNFINDKCANFTYKSLFSSYILALNELSYEKHARKMLTKLTPEQLLRRFCQKLWPENEKEKLFWQFLLSLRPSFIVIIKCVLTYMPIFICILYIFTFAALHTNTTKHWDSRALNLDYGLPLSLFRAHSWALSCFVTCILTINKYMTFKPTTCVLYLNTKSSTGSYLNLMHFFPNSGPKQRVMLPKLEKAFF